MTRRRMGPPIGGEQWGREGAGRRMRIRRGYQGLVRDAGWTNGAARAGDCSTELSPGTAPLPGRLGGGGKSRLRGLSSDSGGDHGSGAGR